MLNLKTPRDLANFPHDRIRLTGSSAIFNDPQTTFLPLRPRGDKSAVEFGEILIPETHPALIPFALSEQCLTEICISISVRVKSAPL